LQVNPIDAIDAGIGDLGSVGFTGTAVRNSPIAGSYPTDGLGCFQQSARNILALTSYKVQIPALRGYNPI
jgi:hypothetical protein